MSQKHAKKYVGYVVSFAVGFCFVFYLAEYMRLHFPEAMTYDRNFSLLVAVITACFLLAAFWRKSRKYVGIEHGSSRWGTKKDFKPYRAVENDKAILLSKTEHLSMDQRRTGLANHVLVIGDTGAGKSRFYAKPNIMQMYGSYIITDPSGEHLASEGKMLEDNGYKIKVFDVVHPENSLHFNPFHYYKTPKDVRRFIEMLMLNTSGDSSNPQSKEDFWAKSERLWFSSHIAYLLESCRPEDQNIPSLMKLLRSSSTRDDNDDYVSAIDLLFKDLLAQNPDSFAARQYQEFKLAAGKTLKSILISIAVRMGDFDIPELANLVSNDELELEKLGTEKTAFFLIMDETDPTYNYIISILLDVMFNTLVSTAKSLPERRFEQPIRFIIDEIANIGKIPKFENLLATLRKYNIGLEPLFQDIGQIKHTYKDSLSTVLGNCPIKVFLGGTGEDTTKWVAEQLLGDTTVAAETQNASGTSNSMGTNSYSYNETKAARKLMDITEVARLPKKECIISIKGLPPFRSKKYDLERHPNYRLLSDGKDGYVFSRNKSGRRISIRPHTITNINLEVQ